LSNNALMDDSGKILVRTIKRHAEYKDHILWAKNLRGSPKMSIDFEGLAEICLANN
jgi:hypothetical protein